MEQEKVFDVLLELDGNAGVEVKGTQAWGATGLCHWAVPHAGPVPEHDSLLGQPSTDSGCLFPPSCLLSIGWGRLASWLRTQISIQMTEWQTLGQG